MSDYIFAYRVPPTVDRGPADSDKLEDWTAWFNEIGRHIKDPGNPVFTSQTVGAAGDTVISGYSFITADNLEHATSLAAGCPLLAQGGGVEVGELTPLSTEAMSAARAAQTASR